MTEKIRRKPLVLIGRKISAQVANAGNVRQPHVSLLMTALHPKISPASKMPINFIVAVRLTIRANIAAARKHASVTGVPSGYAIYEPEGFREKASKNLSKQQSI